MRKSGHADPEDGNMEMSWTESLKVFQNSGSCLALSLHISEAYVHHLPDSLSPVRPRSRRRITGVCVGRVNS